MPRNDEIRLTPGTLLNSAIDFAELADLYTTARKEYDRNPLLQVFLLARSLELALKSILRKDGWKERELGGRRYGHDVSSLYNAVLQKHAIPRMKVSPKRQETLNLLRTYYTSKRLEYAIVGAYALPSAAALRGMVYEAMRFAMDHIHGQGTFKRHTRRPHRAARGLEIPGGAPYGNVSRRREIARQRKALRRFLDEAETVRS